MDDGDTVRSSRQRWCWRLCAKTKAQSQLTSEFGIHPLQITQWKMVALESLSEVFGAQRGRTTSEQEELERQLYERIGRLDRTYTAHPEFWVRRMVLALRDERLVVNPKCVRRLLRDMGLEAVYPKPRLSVPGAVAGRFGYLVRDVRIVRPH